MANGLIVQPRSLIVPRRALRKPARPVLDLNDPINRGRTYLWPIAEGTGVTTRGMGVADTTVLTWNGTAANLLWGAGAAGRGGIGISAVAQDGTRFNGPSGFFPIPRTRQFTLMLIVRLHTGSGPGQMLFQGAGTYWNVQFSPVISGTALSFSVVDSSPAQRTVTGPLPAANTPYILIGTWLPGTGIEFFVNGVSQGTTSFAGTTLRTPTTTFQLGGDSSSAHATSSSYEMLSIWDGTVLTKAQIQRIQIEPYAGLVEAGPRWRVGTAAAGIEPTPYYYREQIARVA